MSDFPPIEIKGPPYLHGRDLDESRWCDLDIVEAFKGTQTFNGTMIMAQLLREISKLTEELKRQRENP